MTDTEVLKSCPFCGGEAEFGIVTQGGEANPDYGGHFVQCTNSRCHGCMGLRFACGDDPKPALFDAWNTRAGGAEPVADSGMDGDTVAKAEWLWTNMPIRKTWDSLATHEKALVCHMVRRLTHPAPDADLVEALRRIEDADTDYAEATDANMERLRTIAREALRARGININGETQ